MRRPMQWIGFVLLCVLVALSPTAVRAERIASLVPGGREVMVPKELLPWVPWVLDGLSEELCPKMGEKAICQWPSSLSLNVDLRGATFALSAFLDADGWIPLPGSGEFWPTELDVDGKPAVVLAQGDVPVTRLQRGQHRIQGRLRWTKAPETLSIPGAVAIIDLVVKNRRVEFPRREENGALWLQVGAEDSDRALERTEIEVMRRIDDGVPLRVTTHLVLHVAGRTRELRLPQPLLPGGRVLSLESPLPLHFDPSGDLVLQIRAGEHRVELVSLHPKPPAELSVPKHEPPWPNQEVWVFNPDTALRQVVPTGAPSIDPAQTNLVDEWKKLQAFALTSERTLVFTTTRRGQPEPPPNQLELSRQLWLDLNGHGYTVRDKITGTMNRDWRLGLLAADLGRAMVSNTDTLVTKDSKEISGVELRNGTVDLTAEWRFEKSLRDLPAVGWNSDVKSLSTILSLPPGWEVLHVSGADRVGNTWLSQWTLWGFFFVLVVAIAVARLLGPKQGVLALLALVLSHDREAAPTLLWVVLLVLLALLDWVPSGKFRSLVRLAWLGSAIALAIVVVDFATAEVRHALYPVTAREDLARPVEVPTANVAAVEQAMEAASAAGDDKEGGSGVRAMRELSSAIPKKGRKALLGLAGSYSEDIADPDSVIQTGPGLPSWNWNTIELGWNGPVQRDQRLGLWLLSPFMTGLVGCLRAALVTWLAYLLVRATAYGGSPPTNRSHRPSLRPLVATGAAALLLLVPRTASAEVDKALLDELKTRLMRAPDCESCVQVSSLDLSLRDGTLRAVAEVHAGAVTTYQVPGPARVWVPAVIRLDGRPAPAVTLYSDGFLHVRVDPGRHRVELEGPIRGQDLTLTSGTSPRFVSVEAKGWTVDGLRDGRIEGSLHFSAEAEAASKSTDAARSQVSLPPWLEVTRTLESGVTFRMVTRVARISPKGDPISVRYPLLPGEEITEAGALVENGQLVVTLDREQTEATYKSVLSAQPKLEFVAVADRPWTEEWRFRCSALWHCNFLGLAPFQQLDDGLYAPRFRPWPGERLSVEFVKPVAARGDSRTIDHVSFEVTPGQRLIAATLRWTERVSKGETEIVQLPAGATVQSLTVNGKAEPIRMNQNRLELALRPGSENVQMTFYCPGGLGTWFKTPSVSIGGKAVNADLQISLPADRWLLFTHGPSWGPKVLLWAYLLLVLGAATLLARLPRSPLRHWQWWLLGLGLTQVPLMVALIIASWFFVMVLRGAWNPGQRSIDIVFRVAVVLWSVVFLACLTGTVYDGLVSNPDMRVVGGGGNGLQLRWYVDRISGQLPTALVLSVPIVVWRLLNLLWALWLAASLVGWLRWGFHEFARHGLWPKPAAPRPVAPRHPMSATPPNVVAPDQPEAVEERHPDRSE